MKMLIGNFKTYISPSPVGGYMGFILEKPIITAEAKTVKEVEDLLEKKLRKHNEQVMNLNLN